MSEVLTSKTFLCYQTNWYTSSHLLYLLIIRKQCKRNAWVELIYAWNFNINFNNLNPHSSIYQIYFSSFQRKSYHKYSPSNIILGSNRIGWSKRRTSKLFKAEYVFHEFDSINLSISFAGHTRWKGSEGWLRSAGNRCFPSSQGIFEKLHLLPFLSAFLHSQWKSYSVYLIIYIII